MLSTHRGEKVRQAIEARGCQLLFLPSYSPDLSPIEEAFSKLKAFLRRIGARTPEALQEAIGQALLTITSQDARGWFGHCGYVLGKSEPSASAEKKRSEHENQKGGHLIAAQEEEKERSANQPTSTSAWSAIEKEEKIS